MGRKQRHDAPEASSDSTIGPYQWHDSGLSLARHAIISLAILTNCAIAALVFIIQRVEIPVSNLTLPQIGSWHFKVTYAALLTPAASLAGSANAFITGTAIALLVDAFAKRESLGQGLTFRRVRHLLQISGGGLPYTLSPLFVIALVLLLCQILTHSSIVASLTPTNGLATYNRTIPLRSFASYAVEDMPVRCEYGGGEFGYGQNCPMNANFGLMSDAGYRTLTNTLPPTFTREGVTYPATMLGISGHISTLAVAILRNVTGDTEALVQPSTVLRTCVPRINVSLACQSYLNGTGYTFEDLGNTDTALAYMQVHQARACMRDGYCTDLQRSDYGNGNIWVMTDDPYDNGDMPLLILGVGKYGADSMQTNTLYCRVSTKEEMLPVVITGNTVGADNATQCADYEQPSALFIQNVGYLAQMLLQKMQGEDGRLEVLGLLEGDQQITRAERLAPLIRTMIAIGATEMYAALTSANTRLSAETILTSQQIRLGQKGSLYQLFVIPPLIYVLLILSGWIWLGFGHAADAHFSPLDPVQMALAGSACDASLSASMRSVASAPTDTVQKAIPGRLRLGEVEFDRIGLTVAPASIVPAPRRSAPYGGNTGNVSEHLDERKSQSPFSDGPAPSSVDPGLVSYFPVVNQAHGPFQSEGV